MSDDEAKWERNGQLAVNVDDVTRYALQRIGELDKSYDWKLSDLVRQVVAEVLHEMNDDGVCSYDFHHSEAEFRTDGVCQCCGLTEADHVRILVCPDTVPEADNE